MPDWMENLAVDGRMESRKSGSLSWDSRLESLRDEVRAGKKRARRARGLAAVRESGVLSG